ncbi:MAG: hypothetical protein ACRDD9_18185 [Shewanella sp.]
MMQEEKITGLYFVEEQQRIWIIYTLRHPEPIDDVNHETYMELLEKIKKTDGTRYDLYAYLLSKQNKCTDILQFLKTHSH